MSHAYTCYFGAGNLAMNKVIRLINVYHIYYISYMKVNHWTIPIFRQRVEPIVCFSNIENKQYLARSLIQMVLCV